MVQSWGGEIGFGGVERQLRGFFTGGGRHKQYIAAVKLMTFWMTEHRRGALFPLFSHRRPYTLISTTYTMEWKRLLFFTMISAICNSFKRCLSGNWYIRIYVIIAMLCNHSTLYKAIHQERVE